MNMAFRYPLWFLAALIMLSVSCSRPLSQQERNEVTEQVTAMLYRYHDDVREHGLQAEFSYIDNSEDFFWVPPGATGPLSFDSVLAAITRNAARYRKVNNSFDMLTVKPITRNTALYTGRIRSAVSDTAGHDTLMFLTETGLAVRRGKEWKLLHGHTSLCPEP